MQWGLLQLPAISRFSCIKCRPYVAQPRRPLLKRTNNCHPSRLFVKQTLSFETKMIATRSWPADKGQEYG